YIAWASVNVEPANNNPYTASGFNANQAEVIVGTPVSNPSGNQQSLAFSAPAVLDITPTSLPPNALRPGSFGPEQDTHPQLVINQNASGQITAAYDDAGSGAKATPPLDFLSSNLLAGGDNYGFSGATGAYLLAGPALQGNWAA